VGGHFQRGRDADAINMCTCCAGETEGEERVLEVNHLGWGVQVIRGVLCVDGEVTGDRRLVRNTTPPLYKLEDI
jgi:hypothetical protein